MLEKKARREARVGGDDDSEGSVAQCSSVVADTKRSAGAMGKQAESLAEPVTEDDAEKSRQVSTSRAGVRLEARHLCCVFVRTCERISESLSGCQCDGEMRWSETRSGERRRDCAGVNVRTRESLRQKEAVSSSSSWWKRERQVPSLITGNAGYLVLRTVQQREAGPR